MKKYILLFLVLLILNVNAHELPNATVQELINSNPELISLPEGTEKALPLAIQINDIENNESFILTFEKDGSTIIKDSGSKDLIMNMDKNSLHDILDGKDIFSEEMLKKLNVKAISMKGKLAIGIIEEALDVKIIQNHGFIQKIISFFAKIIYKIFN